MTKREKNFVLITPAKNEGAVIGHTLASVTAQTVLPCEWIIVSDGSVDNTNELVRAAAKLHPWIRLVELPERPERSFASVVHATEIGFSRLEHKLYDFVGLLDSDVKFQPDYFEKIIACFESDNRLGLAGGVVIDIGQPRDRLPLNRQDVPGAVQFFSRKCYESLGGLLAIPEGGWDALTCARARMNGFKTRLITDLIVDHLKPRNIAEGNIIKRHWQLGVRDYALGYSALFATLKSIGRFKEPPVLLGAFCRWTGYIFASLVKRSSHVPPDLVRFMHQEQRGRILNVFGIRSRKKSTI